MINLDQKQQSLKILKSTYKSTYALYEGKELILNAFRSGKFPIKKHKEKD